MEGNSDLFSPVEDGTIFKLLVVGNYFSVLLFAPAFSPVSFHLIKQSYASLEKEENVLNWGRVGVASNMAVVIT